MFKVKEVWRLIGVGGIERALEAQYIIENENTAVASVVGVPHFQWMD